MSSLSWGRRPPNPGGQGATPWKDVAHHACNYGLVVAVKKTDDQDQMGI